MCRTKWTQAPQAPRGLLGGGTLGGSTLGGSTLGGSSVPSQNFYRAKLRIARYCHGKLSVCLSVCPSVRPSVTLRYRDHIGWNSAKIISPLISVTISLSADTNMTDLLQREHPQILAGI